MILETQSLDGAETSNGYVLEALQLKRCSCSFLVFVQKRLHTPLKADHPERPTITLGWSLEHPLGIIENNVSFVDVIMLWSADQSGITIEVCLLVPNSQLKSCICRALTAAWQE